MINTGTSLWFELDGVPSHTPAWQAINAIDLLQPAQRRGTEPIIIPGAEGGIAVKMRAKPTERIIDVQVLGGWDSDGAQVDEWEGMRANLAALRAAWGTLPSTDDSTRTLTVHDQTAGSVTGPVQVIDLAWSHDQMPAKSILALRLLIPAGELT